MKMLNKLKCMNKNFMINNSDGAEEVEDGSCFLKGVTTTCLWSSNVNHVDTCCMHEEEHG